METASVNSNEENYSQEKLNLRREARRRKILENAKNRLEILNGRGKVDIQDNEEDSAGLNHIFPDPEVEPDPLQYPTSETYTFQESNDVFGSLNADVQTPQRKHFLIRSRIHILLAGLFAYFLALYGTKNNETFSIFVPAGIFIILELIFFREQRKLNPFTTLVIIFSGIKSDKAHKLFHILYTIQLLIVDIGILVFFFCIITFILSLTNNRFGNLITIQ